MAASSQTCFPKSAIGLTIADVVFDAPRAAITAIQRITTQNISTISFAIGDFSDSPSPWAPIIVKLNPPASNLSSSLEDVSCLIPSEATSINTNPKARAAET